MCICGVGTGLYYDAALTNCVYCNSSIQNCSSCSTINSTMQTVCLHCVDGFYLADSTTCTLCPTTCTSCTSPSACTLCVSGFSLFGGSCECNNTLGLFYDAAVTQTCKQCSDLVTNCVTCTNLTNNSYACIDCVAGMYPSQASLCQSCPSNCGSCTNASFCISCPSTFMPTPVGGVCVCDNTSNVYLNTTLMICALCPTNCLTCNSSTCLTCASGFVI